MIEPVILHFVGQYRKSVKSKMNLLTHNIILNTVNVRKFWFRMFVICPIPRQCPKSERFASLDRFRYNKFVNIKWSSLLSQVCFLRISDMITQPRHTKSEFFIKNHSDFGFFLISEDRISAFHCNCKSNSYKTRTIL